MGKLLIEKEKLFKVLFIILFAIYILVLLRVILFKDIPLYNLFKSLNDNYEYRSVSLVPFIEMIGIINSGGMSPLWILKNIVGNIAIFIPLGLFLPSIFGNKLIKTIFIGASVSLCFEILQYILAMGISDIDDLILNVIGVIIGFGVYKVIDNIFNDTFIKKKTILVILLIMGICGFFVVLFTQPELFRLAPTKATFQNEMLVKEFDNEEVFARGALISVSVDEITIQTSDEPREQYTFSLEADAEIVTQTVEQKYFINSLIEEKITFDKIDSLELNNYQEKHDWASISVWSQDGIKADKIMVSVVVES